MLKSLFQKINNLSLNVVFGAMLCGWMFMRLPNGAADFDFYTIPLLGLATWAIYLLDRLLDIRIYPPEFSERHHFHFTNKRTLFVLLVILVVAGIVLCFFVDKKVLLYGICLSIGIGVYLFLLNSFLKKDHLQWVKEPSTAVFYTLAVVGVAFVTLPNIYLSSWILAFLFFLVVSQNLLLFSYFEFLQKPDNKNTVSYFGQKSSMKMIRWIGIAVLFFVIFFFTGEWNYNSKVAFLILLMSLILSFLPAKAQFFLQNERYRWIGDGVFLLPVILLF
ncbi:hypothetical protein SAMN06298216_3822 [Spirosomataceae bacterium TFI 002]|nr:hypothetical protein SAMN06298216_3822 [Spirosomataceae bacterium TFI 002]